VQEALKRLSIEIIPLGGTGEIGKNMNVVRCNGQIIVVDAGISFPTEELPGVDLVMPDPTYLLEHSEEVQAIILTHGHEDHVGALPFLLPALPVPVYGTPMTLALVESKLKERKIKADLCEVAPGKLFQLGVFEIEPVQITHSIPQSVAYAIHTPAGTVFFTGDFKFDYTPVDGQPTDFNRLARIGDRGVLVLLSDCTNVERPGWGESESKVGDTFYWLFADAPGRILITCFASSLHRVQQVFDTAAIYRKKVVAMGRRMEQNIDTALGLGLLRVPPETYISSRKLDELEENQIVVLTTGSQGEPLSALSLMAQDEYPRLKIKPNDTVILSATPIPGNESLVWRTVNRLIRLGARVIYDRISPVHVSGHAGQEELKLMLSLLKPKYVAPVHGEPRHQAIYRDLAFSMGYREEQFFLLENGSTFMMDEQGARIKERAPVGRLLIEDGMPGGVPEQIIHDRRHLAQEGMLVAVIAINGETGEIVAPLELITKGFDWHNGEQPQLAQEVIADVLSQFSPAELADWDSVRGEIVTVLKKFCRKHLNRRPMIIPIVMEV
jgi:ribonuclease J